MITLFRNHFQEIYCAHPQKKSPAGGQFFSTCQQTGIFHESTGQLCREPFSCYSTDQHPVSTGCLYCKKTAVFPDFR